MTTEPRTDADFARPRLVLSECLELEACRYNGQSIRARIVPLLAPWVDLVPVCPEVEIGLGVPRPPVRLVDDRGATRLVQPQTGRDVTGDMTSFGRGFLDAVGEVDGFLLKSRSPSCGIKDVKVYAGPERAPPVRTEPGIFAREVMERFPLAAVEDEGRLTSFRIRHHFLTRLFASAALRAVAASRSVGALVRFHAEHKLLLLAHHQHASRELGRLVAGARGRPFEDVAAEYASGFAAALARPARVGAHVNALQHAQGHVTDDLTPAERAHFGSVLDEYRAGRLPLAAPLAVVRSWIARFEVAYLHAQRYFQPYPVALVDLADSAAARAAP